MACLGCQAAEGGGRGRDCTCTAFRQLGVVVVVGSGGLQGEAVCATDGTTLDVQVGGFSMVANPFTGGPRKHICEAYDDLLGLVMTEDLDLDRLASDFHRLHQEIHSGVVSAGPVERRLLDGIAQRHGLCLRREACGFSVAGLRAWVGYHVQLLRSGRSLGLCDPSYRSPCPPWTCPAQSLVGALAWAAELTYGAVEVSSTFLSYSLHPLFSLLC